MHHSSDASPSPNLEEESSVSFRDPSQEAEGLAPSELEAETEKPCCCLNCAKRQLLKPEHRCGSRAE